MAEVETIVMERSGGEQKGMAVVEFNVRQLIGLETRGFDLSGRSGSDLPGKARKDSILHPLYQYS